jgi:hypothetical protein
MPAGSDKRRLFFDRGGDAKDTFPNAWLLDLILEKPPWSLAMPRAVESCIRGCDEGTVTRFLALHSGTEGDPL